MRVDDFFLKFLRVRPFRVLLMTSVAKLYSIIGYGPAIVAIN